MKKILWALIIILSLIVVGSYFYQASKVVPAPVVATTTPEIVVKKETDILLYPENGEVSFKATPTDEFQKASTSPTIIPNQAIVKTGEGKASILLPDNSSISLDKNTEITVNFGEQTTSIYQMLGMTYHRVQALVSGKTYQVQTAGTLAAVRGTKFAVQYDEKTKKTKVAVTENKVEVATIPKAIGTTTPQPEVLMVEQGKMISVEDEVKMVAGKPAPMMSLVEMEKDAVMNTFIEEKKSEDIRVEEIKSIAPTEEVFRQEMKRAMFEDDGTAPRIIEETKVEEVPTAPTRVESPTSVKPPTTAPTTTVKPTTVTNTTVVKLGEEEFFSKFEPLFISHFYVDDEAGLACDQKLTPEARVNAVTTFARNSGYPFTKPSLLSFAQAIDAYCQRKDPDTKLKLQNRFDDEYPFTE